MKENFVIFSRAAAESEPWSDGTWKVRHLVFLWKSLCSWQAVIAWWGQKWLKSFQSYTLSLVLCRIVAAVWFIQSLHSILNQRLNNSRVIGMAMAPTVCTVQVALHSTGEYYMWLSQLWWVPIIWLELEGSNEACKLGRTEFLLK